MVHSGASRPVKLRRVAVLLTAAALLAFFDGSAADAQSFMRSPGLNIGARSPGIDPTMAPRVGPMGRAGPGVGVVGIRPGPRFGLRSPPPYLRYAPRYYPACGDFTAGAECADRPVSLARGGGGHASAGKQHAGPRRDAAQAALTSRAVANEIVAEIDGALSDTQADRLARRYGLARLQSQHSALTGGTIGLFRITDRRSVATASREFAAATGVRSVQPNFRYVLQDQNAALTEGDPAQYALAKLRLPEAHTLAHGTHVTVAVIDSAIDATHPELADTIAASFDALGGKAVAHAHGTGVAGAIVSHARLMGSAPAAKILAIRAFGAPANGAESTSFVVFKSLDYAVVHGAQIINMSFAGPRDALVARSTAAVAAKGIVMVAAAGNAGPKSAPLYPAADPEVIAVSATDAQDRLFSASNRGGYLAVAAPGVDIFLPAPDGQYQMASGTSFSAAYVSGVAALMLERNPALKPEEVRATLMKTARDLGAPGRDDLFGAGEADAYAAVAAAGPAPAVAASDAPALAGDQHDPAATAVSSEPVAAVASDKPAAGEPNH